MQPKKIPFVVEISKDGEMIYFSQLDLMRLLERALRRTSLPLYYTQGFNPHVKISFLSGLKLGVKGTLTVRLYFREEISAQEIKQSLGRQLPQGLTIN
jgi:radical SAM-linked protein